MISVPMPGRQLYAVIWKVQVGRVPLYLLDTNIPENALEEDRNLTDRLYGGDRRTRIRQEILIGHRRHSRARRARPAPENLPHERGARGVSGAGTRPPVHGAKTT